MSSVPDGKSFVPSHSCCLPHATGFAGSFDCALCRSDQSVHCGRRTWSVRSEWVGGRRFYGTFTIQLIEFRPIFVLPSADCTGDAEDTCKATRSSCNATATVRLHLVGFTPATSAGSPVIEVSEARVATLQTTSCIHGLNGLSNGLGLMVLNLLGDVLAIDELVDNGFDRFAFTVLTDAQGYDLEDREQIFSKVFDRQVEGAEAYIVAGVGDCDVPCCHICSSLSTDDDEKTHDDWYTKVADVDVACDHGEDLTHFFTMSSLVLSTGFFPSLDGPVFRLGPHGPGKLLVDTSGQTFEVSSNENITPDLPSWILPMEMVDEKE